ncbi:hypothetical protein KC333_g7463 [Hortaea werneckii]|nr:hypothetical protein KC333_g7463 [Hortaea werneckii]KAI7307668.1 hypothetical protein KC326_g7612 [Hortaea werneckii]
MLMVCDSDQACIDTCQETAASDLGCIESNLADCFCLADFATQAKACLYESGCSSDVSTFYDGYDSTCASASVSASASASASSSSSSATVDCVATCETSAASSLDCDQSESSCFCTDDFASAVKSCLYSTDGCGGDYKASFYEEYDSLCASSSTSAGVSSNTVTATSVAISSAAVSPSSGAISSASITPSSTYVSSGYSAPYGSSNATASATGSAGATTSVEAFTGAGVSIKQASFAGAMIAALFSVILL